MSAELSERRRLILKLVVLEFIDTSTPVASELLVRKYSLRASSATIRNELAALEDMGFLTHWHTSAGRVPTDAGYRFFVENLMDWAPLPASEQRTIRHQFYQVRTELDQWIQLAGAVLARTAQNASVVTPPRAYQSRFKHIELISIHDTTILMVLVLHDGTIRQQTLTLDTAFAQDELSRLAARINERLYDAPVAKIEEVRHQPVLLISGAGELEGLVLELVIKAMRQFEDQYNSDIHSDGLMEILSQPEFSQVERIRQMVEILQSGKGLSPLIMQAMASSNGVQIVIGGEHERDEMREYSVVLARYGINGDMAGVLGVIGPTRMAYPRTISAVRYLSAVMSDMLTDLYGEGKA
ncbi:heat-inducible transcription repressor HrcA [Chloroflexia bacterium SDU3-3]|nr:heat-inducible transcription repressor HrcA [Chloroflexia bacterium SDU3-3]